ncbi:hypothetical protein LINPERHAP2_LOCUS14064 [Linum perenne]
MALNNLLEVMESGKETIDCVDKYKQPAFNHPLLKNHTLRSKPSSHPVGSNSIVTQKWHESGEFCPEGTVPILRKPTNNTTSNDKPKPSYDFSKFAIAYMPAPRGASADLNVWKPRVGMEEVTVAHVRVSDGAAESVEAGWRVGPGWFQIEPVFYAYWTTNGETGCYDLDCPGFVQESKTVTLGAEMTPVSTYGGKQRQFNVKIYKDFKTGDWWLLNGETEIGYWPKKLFYNLNYVKPQVEWGGKATKLHHNEIAQMGSGHFSGEGFGKAAYVANLEYADEMENWIKAPLDLQTLTNRPDCYDIKSPEYKVDYGSFFFYGGDGKACYYQ